jgi:hypothetical protein
VFHPCSLEERLASSPVPRLAPLDLVALGLGVAAAAFGIAADTGPLLAGIAVAVALARLVRARTAAHLVCWLVVPMLLWIGWGTWAFVAGTLCLFGQAAITALRARGRPEHASDVAVALRVTLAAAAGITAVALLAFVDVYS